jgi:mRNA degradation ribonuclease J1/J2
VEFGERMNREVVFLGRSLIKYTTAAKNVGMAPFLKNVKLISYREANGQIHEESLTRIKSKFMVVCTDIRRAWINSRQDFHADNSH